jgi:hypothetical protein
MNAHLIVSFMLLDMPNTTRSPTSTLGLRQVPSQNCSAFVVCIKTIHNLHSTFIVLCPVFIIPTVLWAVGRVKINLVIIESGCLNRLHWLHQRQHSACLVATLPACLLEGTVKEDQANEFIRDENRQLRLVSAATAVRRLKMLLQQHHRLTGTGLTSILRWWRRKPGWAHRIEEQTWLAT